MTDYNLRFTNPARAGFTVPDSKTNGPATPNTAAFMPGAVSANTTLQILGHGWPQYGVPVWQDFIYLLENYANATPPSYPIPGQLWFNDSSQALSIYDGSTWIPFQSSVVTGDFDMNGFHIINLAPPTNPNDAVNLAYVNANFLKLSGGAVTGTITMSGASTQIVLPNAPILGTNAANKAYVDTQIATVTADLGNYLPLSGGALTGPVTSSSSLTISGLTSLASVSASGNATIGGSLGVTGPATFNSSSSFAGPATFSSPVTLQSTTLTITSGGSIDMSNNYIDNLATPLTANQAATKQYVDSLISSGGGSAFVSGAFNPTNGVLTLTRADSSVLTVTGDAAPFVHTHTGNDVTVVTSVMTGTFLPAQAIADFSAPYMYLQRAIDLLNQGVSVQQGRTRKFVTIGDGTTTLINLPFEYITDMNNLQVYVNGVKQLADSRAAATLSYFSNLSAGGPAVPGPDTFQLSVATNSGSVTDYDFVVPSDGYTNIGFVQALTAGLTGAGVPVTATIDGNQILIYSSTVGVGSFVTLTAGTTNDLLIQLSNSGATIANGTASGSYAYNEATGPATVISTSLQFNTAPALGDVIEILSAPQFGTSNSI